MKTKQAVWLAFLLNLSFAIVEFIAGGIFGSSAVLADSVHDLGDAIAIGISAFLEAFQPLRCHGDRCDTDDRVWHGDFGKYGQTLSPPTCQ